MSFASDYQKETKRQDARGRCLHFADGARCNEIISAHSIQKRGQLSLIAEQGHIYRLNADFSTLHATGGSPHPRRKGVRKTSTFAGFCKHHDNVLFEPIDNAPLGPSKQQVALYAYRCLCREYFVKENAVELIKRIKDHPEVNDESKQLLESSLTGHSLGFNGLVHHKDQYDEALRTRRYEDFEYTYFISESRCSLQLSGLLYPDFDFLGRRLQNLGDWSSPLDMIAFFTAPTTLGWAFCFGWHKSSNQTCIPFMESLAHRIAHGEKAHDALLRFSFSACENHAFRISWWNQLTDEAKETVLERINLMIHPYIPVPPNYLVAGCEGIADWTFEYVQTTLHADA